MMDKIKIAVWNIYGPTHGDNSPASAGKINAFQHNEDPDVAFYLEAPSGKAHLPDINDEKWIPSTEPLWADTGISGNPRGILTVNRNKDIRLKRFTLKEENFRTAVALHLFYGDKKEERLRILAVWVTPSKKTTSQEVYRNTLKKIMESYRTFLNSNIPCIVVGDTNVNLAAGSPDKSVIEKEHITRGCQKNRSDIEAFLKDSPFDLTLWENGLKENTLFKNDKWYRCDLMLVSKGTSPHAYLGEREYRDKDKKEKIWTSDHRPIIFEVSLTN